MPVVVGGRNAGAVGLVFNGTVMIVPEPSSFVSLECVEVVTMRCRSRRQAAAATT